MNVPDYLLGLGTLPAVAAAGWLLWQFARAANVAGEAIAKRLPLSKAQDRAGFAAFAASTRRAHLFVFGGVGVAVMVGYDGKNARKVYDAVYPVLVGPARVNLRRRAAGPQDPGIEFSGGDEG
ncbi:hypothetical protein [Micromonospora sp. WMMD737]|uniref:hypothetical protein n=1 Tax=Micromonospora sp. WMMD737 TaxID=3404113 RepID=UPI003B930767